MKYEYLIIRDKIYFYKEKMDDLGREGWELVGVTLDSRNGDCTAYFKRLLKP